MSFFQLIDVDDDLVAHCLSWYLSTKLAYSIPVWEKEVRALLRECALASPVTWTLFHIKPQGYMSGLPYGEIIKCVFPISSGVPEVSLPSGNASCFNVKTNLSQKTIGYPGNNFSSRQNKTQGPLLFISRTPLTGVNLICYLEKQKFGFDLEKGTQEWTFGFLCLCALRQNWHPCVYKWARVDRYITSVESFH